MSTLQQQLKVVHKQLTRLMSQLGLDSRSREILAKAVNNVLDISQQLAKEDATASPETSQPDKDQIKTKRSLVKRAIACLAKIPEIVEYIVKRWPKENDGT